MTYIKSAITAVNAELADLDPELARLYALLAVTMGEGTTWRDVHDAWAVWRDRTQPEHRSIVPFDELTPEVQALDEPYAEGIRRAARKLEATYEPAFWAVHVQGPDDLLAAADRTDADRMASEINEAAEFARNRNASPNLPTLLAVVVPWHGTAEHHAEALVRQAEEGEYTPCST